MFTLKNARLIPELTEGFHAALADVVVDGKTIRSILPAGTAPATDNDLDLNGKTLIPGMFDLHAHLYFSQENFAAVALRGTVDYVFDSITYAKEFLKQGYTTVRDCGNPDYIGVVLRDAIEAGTVPGPRIQTSGKCISPYAKSNDTFPNLYYEVNSPSEILAACRYEYAKGVDFFKYMGTGSVANLTGVPGALITSKEELFALQAAAESMDTYAAVHCHGKEGILYCAQAGIHTIEHASMIDAECIEEILRQNGKTTIVPTLFPIIQVHRYAERSQLDQRVKDKIEKVFEHTHQLVEATRSGILTGWGTDVSLTSFQDMIGFEFESRREVGYTNIEMLQQVTINSAKILGWDDKLGTIKEGKLADLVVIDGNPDEQIDVMFQYPMAVYKEGVRYF